MKRQPTVLIRGWWLAGVLLGLGFAGVPTPPARAAEQSAAASDAPPFRLERRLPKPPNVPPDPPEVLIGERLFLETRFAQFFAARCGDNVNTNLPAGDPVLDTVTSPSASYPGRFRGQSMNCRACHPVSEYRRAGGGNRNYADYAARTPIPARADGRSLTLRNSQPLVNATVPRDVPLALHHDGEFATSADLVIATFTGRNYGWLASEGAAARRHFARVIRGDDGTGALAREFGGSYRRVFAGTDPAIPDSLRLEGVHRMETDVAEAGDDEILAHAARLVEAYLDSLFFSRNELGEYDGSPYDAFLEINGLPRKPDLGQEDRYYSRHLRTLVDHGQWRFDVNEHHGWFRFLRQPYRFGALELAGLRIFFNTPQDLALQRGASGGVGNCIACHAAPHFTDFGFHNTGVAQEEYDGLHGAGAFGRIEVPDLAARARDPLRWLGPSAVHPEAAGVFLSIPDRRFPGRTDLGLWNVFANPDHPGPQDALRRLLDPDARLRDDARLLPLTLARFKTPTLRGLSFSEPYFHNGQAATLEEAIRFYLRAGEHARAGRLRNPAPELSGIRLTEADVAPLAAFLRALNEDYE